MLAAANDGLVAETLNVERLRQQEIDHNVTAE
jgi:hypothetical protein